MNKELLKTIVLKSDLRQRLMAAGIMLTAMALLLYQLMLAPYAAHFNSLRAQLKSQKNLLNLKMSRAGNLEVLNKEYAEIEKKLQEIDSRFFTDSEADAFMKQLPKTVSDFGNRLVMLKPQLKGRVILRSEKLKKFVLGENLPTEKELIDVIEKNKKSIDAGETTTDQLVQILSMLPEGQKDQLKTIWQQPDDLDFYAALALRQMDIETTSQGKFEGILSLLEWFEKCEKQVSLSRIQINTANQVAGVETRFIVTLYIIEQEVKL